jgi:hypothetical protein
MLTCSRRPASGCQRVICRPEAPAGLFRNHDTALEQKLHSKCILSPYILDSGI